MNAAFIIALANGLVGLLETLAPEIARLVKTGQITVQEQEALDAKIRSLRPGGSAFAGPEWKVEP